MRREVRACHFNPRPWGEGASHATAGEGSFARTRSRRVLQPIKLRTISPALLAAPPVRQEVRKESLPIELTSTFVAIGYCFSKFVAASVVKSGLEVQKVRAKAGGFGGAHDLLSRAGRARPFRLVRTAAAGCMLPAARVPRCLSVSVVYSHFVEPLRH